MAYSPYTAVKLELMTLMKEALSAAGYKDENIDNTIDVSKGIGDLSCNISFRIAKKQKKAPNDVAMELVAKISKPVFFEKITADGGYINFHLNKAWYTQTVLDYAAKLTDSVSDIGQNERVIVEYPSVNPNKPWHLGHLKNAVLGDAIANIHGACGYNVEREDFIEDLGMQVVESIWGYIHINKEPGTKKFDQWMGEEYVKVNEYMEKTDIKPQLSQLLQNMELSGTYEAKLARELAEMCVRAQNQTAFDYGISRDILIWETDMVSVHLVQEGMAMLEKAGVIKRMKDSEFQNCMVIDLSTMKDLPPEFQGLKEKIKVLVRKDGTPTYVAKDIAFHMWKFGLIQDQFKYSVFIEKQPSGKPLYTTAKTGKSMQFGNIKRAVNIIDVRQSYPQGLLKLAFNAMGKAQIADGIMHLAYGELEMESGISLSGRKGNWIGNTADDLLTATKDKALSLIGTRFQLSTDEQQKVSSSVALAAIKFDLLRLSPEKKTLFSWERALNFEGTSGPYCQYTHARAVRMLSDAHFTQTKIDSSVITSNSEFYLVKLISMLSEKTEKACAELRPNVITEYVGDLALAFSSFYEKMPVLKAKTEQEKQARLALTFAFANSMKVALKMLGITAPERM